MEKNELNIILEDIIKDDITYYQELKLPSTTTKIANFLGLKPLLKKVNIKKNYPSFNNIDFNRFSTIPRSSQRDTIDDLLSSFSIKDGNKTLTLKLNIAKLDRLKNKKTFQKLSFIGKAKVIENFITKKTLDKEIELKKVNNIKDIITNLGKNFYDRFILKESYSVKIQEYNYDNYFYNEVRDEFSSES
jgi:hypothetical protein